MPRQWLPPVTVLAVFLIGLAAVGCSSMPSPSPELTAAPSSIQTVDPTLDSAAQATVGSAKHCTPTRDDGLSPSYTPGTPVRSTVGQGHLLTGTVVSSVDCSPIPGAQLEFWPEYPGLGHLDEARATLFTDRSGSYRFECDPPEHIHMRISAEGYITIAQNSYHPDGQPQGAFDIVLAPETP